MKITDPASVKGAKMVQPVPPLVNQVGATCGLYALSCVIRFWHDLLTQKGTAPTWNPTAPRGPANAPSLKERLNAEIIQRGGKASSNPTLFSGVRPSGGTLLDIAETLGSRIGEVFDAEALAMTATRAGFEAWLARWDDPSGLWTLLVHHIDQNIPCIIAYDNSDPGDPGTTTHGARAHWAVLFGYVDGSPRQVLATHGWGHYYLWDATTLRESNEQLDQFGRWGTWYRSEDPLSGKVDWHGPDRPKNPTAQPTALPDNYNKKNAKPGDAVAAYQISSEMDLKKQLVIVMPKGEIDFSPPSKGAVVGATGSVGGGQHF